VGDQSGAGVAWGRIMATPVPGRPGIKRAQRESLRKKKLMVKKIDLALRITPGPKGQMRQGETSSQSIKRRFLDAALCESLIRRAGTVGAA